MLFFPGTIKNSRYYICHNTGFDKSWYIYSYIFLHRILICFLSLRFVFLQDRIKYNKFIKGLTSYFCI
jgi:hypothetical protein